MCVSYSIGPREGIFTLVYEYWNEIHIRTYRVTGHYKGEHICDFLDKNEKFEEWFDFDAYDNFFQPFCGGQLELHF